MRLLIVVTHLLGTGHLARALTLARAFQNAGHRVRLVSGGMPAPHLDTADIDLLQLPPLRSDGVDFTRLLDGNGMLATSDLLNARTSLLSDQLAAFPPDVVITELFPFGRRILRHEFLALLNAAKTMPKRPLICASIRDILAPPSKPEKVAKTDAILAAYYDAVLVHADPDVTPLSVSWPPSTILDARVHYTGFVAPPAALPHPKKAGTDEVIVSAGGGGVGAALFATALATARNSPRHFRILVGGKDAADQINTLRDNAPINVTIEPARRDFRQLLHHAAVSVSMCGYNTALDLLQTGCPAVLVPFDAGNEVEQGLRADALAKLPGFAVLRSSDLTADSLLRSFEALSNGPNRPPKHDGFDGAEMTVQLVTRLRKGDPCA